MLIFCEECGQRVNLSVENIDTHFRRFRCERCGELLKVRRDARTAAIESFEDVEREERTRFSSSLKSGSSSKVLLVDDSSMIRKALKEILETEDSLKVVGEASNGAEALELIPRLNPDAVTLDVNMPVMDGLTTLKNMMIRDPRPAVMISALTSGGAKVTFDALKYGAVDFVSKPSRKSGGLERQRKEIVRKISLAAGMDKSAIRLLRASASIGKAKASGMEPPPQIVCIGAAEGGYGSLLKIITGLRPHLPAAFLIVLYAEPAHVKAFASYLDAHSLMSVKRAKDKESLLGGYCYLASGDEYFSLEKQDGRLLSRLNPNPFRGRRGAVNMLMISTAEMFGKKAAGVLLSGFGEDGTEGLREISRRGGCGFVQDPRTCLCRDMPLSAIESSKHYRVIRDYEMAAEFNAFFDRDPQPFTEELWS